MVAIDQLGAFWRNNGEKGTYQQTEDEERKDSRQLGVLG